MAVAVSEHGVMGERIVNFITAADLSAINKILEEYWYNCFTKAIKIDKILNNIKGVKKGQVRAFTVCCKRAVVLVKDGAKGVRVSPYQSAERN